MANRKETNMDQWKVGDVVRLKSGGPVMTVHRVTSEGTCECTWFVNDEPKYETFVPETLRKAPIHQND